MINLEFKGYIVLGDLLFLLLYSAECPLGTKILGMFDKKKMFVATSKQTGRCWLVKNLIAESFVALSL